MSRKQLGAALPIALMILLLVTIITVAGVNDTNLELQMSVNEEERTDAFQTAQAAVDQASEDDNADNFGGGAPGQIYKCTSNVAASAEYSCANGTLTLSGAGFDTYTAVKINRMYPPTQNSARRQTSTYSGRFFRVMTFKVEGENQLPATPGTYVKIIQGVAQPFVAPSQ